MIASWNVRGLNRPFKQHEVHSLVMENKVSLLGINESRVKQPNSARIERKLLWGWKVFYNYNYHPNGCILKEVTIIQKQFTFITSFIYRFNTHLERQSLWDSIRQAASLASTTPWLLMEDFNVVRSAEERLGGDSSWADNMEDLNLCCADCGMEI